MSNRRRREPLRQRQLLHLLAVCRPARVLHERHLIRSMLLYGCILRKAQPLPVAAAISAFWTTYIGFKPHHMKPFYEWVTAEPLKSLVVMGYRNTVGANDGVSDGIACLDGPAIDYWINCPSMGPEGLPEWTQREDTGGTGNKFRPARQCYVFYAGSNRHEPDRQGCGDCISKRRLGRIRDRRLSKCLPGWGIVELAEYESEFPNGVGT